MVEKIFWARQFVGEPLQEVIYKDGVAQPKMMYAPPPLPVIGQPTPQYILDIEARKGAEMTAEMIAKEAALVNLQPLKAGETPLTSATGQQYQQLAQAQARAQEELSEQDIIDLIVLLAIIQSLGGQYGY